MKATHPLAALLAACLFTAAAWAQTSSQPLNLKLPPQNDLPPSSLPASGSTVAKPASGAPGVYYGDTSGRMGNTETHSARAQPCDDSTYNQAQTHGSVGMGVMAGNHMSGNYQSGAVSVSKNLGDCDDPKGSVNFSIGVGQGHFHGR